MDNTIRVFSGRTISPKDMELILWAVKTYRRLSRKELASTVCELLGWATPAGRPKVTQCVAFLEQLESEDVLQLPQKQIRKKYKTSSPIIVVDLDTTEVQGELKDIEPIKLTIAYPGEALRRWRSYVEQYHMLGYKKVFGSRLHYFIKSGEKDLGCIQFSASSWSLESRDKWIGWELEDKKERLQLIINNSRYLIFPWVKIKNLASKALSLAARQIQEDWLREFCYAPVLLETFVDSDHFAGTCYKAANWIYLGQTKGLGRSNRSSKQIFSTKDIYIYPLQKDFRACLKGEKPCRMVDPDEC